MKELFGERILVRPIPSELKTQAGILIPDAFAEKSKLATIVKIGNGISDLKEGETIVYGPDSGFDVEHDGENLLLLHENEFYGVV